MVSYAKAITNLVNQGKSLQAITLFAQFQKAGTLISEFILSATVRACGRLAAITEGKQLHCIVTKNGFDRDVVLMTSLIDMYSKSSRLKEARHLFDEMPVRDVFAVNTMISALCWSRFTSEAVDLFNSMAVRNVESWNSLISGLAQGPEKRAGLSFFKRMRSEGGDVDDVTMVTVLSICTDFAALFDGTQVHSLVIQFGYELYVPVCNATLDMYAKCGSMDSALSCFDTMPIRNVVSWTALIEGYGRQGSGVEAVRGFDRMMTQGITPNEVTFLGALHACCHSGLVQEGYRIFNIMRCKYQIAPKIEHYTCIADMLARSGRLKEAIDFVESMPLRPDARLLTALLSSCCWHGGDLELARGVGEKLLACGPREAGAYVLLTNLYGRLSDLEGVARVKMLMCDRGVVKEAGHTRIQIRHGI